MAEVHYRYTALTDEQIKILNLARKIGYKKVNLFLENLSNNQASLDFILKQPDSSLQTISDLQNQLVLVSNRITKLENASNIRVEEQEEEKTTRQNWEDRLNNWTSSDIKKMALSIKNTILRKYPDALHGITGTEYYFSKAKKGPTNCFTVLGLRKKKLAIRVRFDPTSSSDPHQLLKEKVYTPWYFLGNGQERELQINNDNLIDNAMQMIIQSYNLI